MIKSQNKTGFLGFIAYLINFFELYEQIQNDMNYLLSYKLSQDHLDNFFSTMRCREVLPIIQMLSNFFLHTNTF